MPRLWIDNTAVMVLTSGGGLAFRNLLPSLGEAAQRGHQMTLLRTIIGIDIGNTVHDSGEGSQLISVGIGICSTEALAIGVTALSDPAVDTDYPTRGWVWRGRYRTFGFAADQPTIFTRRVDLDMRSQRKLDNGESFLIGKNEDLEGVASTVDVRGLIRQLWLVG